jgi:hypothetical protein
MHGATLKKKGCDNVPLLLMQTNACGLKSFNTPVRNLIHQLITHRKGIANVRKLCYEEFCTEVRLILVQRRY